VLHYFNAAVLQHNQEGELDSNEMHCYPPMADIDIQPKMWENLCNHPLHPLKYGIKDQLRDNFLRLANNLSLFPDNMLKKIQNSVTRSIIKKRKRLSGSNTPMKKRRKSSIGNSIVTAATMQIKQTHKKKSFSTLNISSSSSRSNQGITATGANKSINYIPELQNHFPFDDPFRLKECYSLHIEKYYSHWKDIKDIEVEEES